MFRLGMILVTLSVLALAQQPPALWGDPVLVGTPAALHLEEARPGALFLAALSSTRGPTRLPGIGTVALGPDLSVFYGGRTDGNGWARIPLPPPPTAGLTLHFQVLVFDPAAPGGMLLSTPLALTSRRPRYLVADEGDAPGPGFPGVPGGVVTGAVTGTGVRRIPTGDFPERVVLPRTGTRAYSVSRYTSPGTLVVLDLAAGRVAGRIPTAPYPQDLDLTADDRYALLLCGGGRNPAVLQVYDLTTGRRRASFAVPSGSFRVRACGARRGVVVTATGDAYLLDLNAPRLLGPVDLAGADPFLFDVLYPAGGGPLAYAATGEPKPLFPIPPGPKPGHVVAFDVRTGRIAARVQVGTHPAALREVALPGGTALVTLNRASRDVTVVDGASLRVLRTVTVSVGNPMFLAALAGQPAVAVLEAGQAPVQRPPAGVPGYLEILDVAAGRRLARFAVTADLQTDLAGFGGTLWVTSRFRGRLERWAPSGRLLGTVAVGKTPVDVAVP